MSRPPIKAMEAVKRYCEKNKSCKGCPINTLTEYGYSSCREVPEGWNIKKEGDNNDGADA